MAPATNNSEHVKLEKRLILLAWLTRQFGYASNKELLTDVAQAADGFDPTTGRSYVYHRLVGWGEKLLISMTDLLRYDDNVRGHLGAMNRHRRDRITLRYFQHLALLFTEAFLDWRFGRPGEFLHSLNEFVADRNAGKPPGDAPDPMFTEGDLNKLAFWMATGSGKTLLMHANLRQFLHYNQDSLDNILLITPNEGLTEQHITEMAASDIPSERFSLNESGLLLAAKNTVRVIEITKLVEQKRGGGVSVPVECFEGNNLIFVDEGHKGSGGEAWRRFRDALGATGFTFEYSATFGQALTAARNDELTAEYGKAICFDYSYKYFYGDGYGKDFQILNVRQETTEDKTDLLLLGNLLSFYEQQRCYIEQASELRPYGIDRPLWVFVGSSVNAVYTENRRKRSDVLTVARFLHRVLENPGGWAVRGIEAIIEGTTGLIDSDGRDVFAGKFQYLRSVGAPAAAICSDVLTTVFRTPAAGALHMCDIRGKTGELGLKAGGSDEYFGLIYIGDTGTFKKLVEEDDSGIVVEEDVLAQSLFDGINEPDTSVNVLIGAKKFMEGWNSWRVSNMGLLNIGRTEGSEIIQLFGRGVRLRGKNLTLKRSAALDGDHPRHIKLLETLNIFAVRANYMAQFREYLEREGVETEGHVELPLAIRPNHEFLEKGLVLPRVPVGRSFADETNVLLVPDRAARVSVDMSLKVESLRSSTAGIATVAMRAGQEQGIPPESLELVDWDAVYITLLELKEKRGFSNLVIRPDAPRRILEARDPRLYKLIADQAVVKPDSFAGVAVLEEAVVTILRKYVEKFYRVSQERWDTDNMEYRALGQDDPNFKDYLVRIPRKERELIAAVKQLIDEGQRVYDEELTQLPNIHFDRHIYQPLLVERGDRIRSDPPGLAASEVQFVEALRKFVREEADDALADKEVFLLRNLSRGKGIGFFENEGFYPDFILWIKRGAYQRVVFVEPHGMRMEKSYWSSDKVHLFERLGELTQVWGAASGLKNVVLDSFIISATPYEELRQYYGTGDWPRHVFEEAHILFAEEPRYPALLFR